MPILTEAEVRAALVSLGGWQIAGGELVRTFHFPSFRAAIAFVDRVADLAEAQDHHPDIDIRYTRVHLRLLSHDVGGLTRRDLRMAKTLTDEFGSAPASLPESE